MPKILVTGGLGYIGSHTVVELVNNGYEPVIIDNLSNSRLIIKDNLEKILGRSIQFYQEDCSDEEVLENIFSKEGIEGVIHFAAHKSVGESVEKPLMYYHNNLNSTLKLIEMIKKHKASSFIFSSSCSVYGNPDSLPVTESSPIKHAESPYASTKQMCERIISDVHVAKVPFGSVILRYFNPIGAHPSALIGELPLGKPNNLVPVITKTAIGKIPEMQVFGNDYNTPDGTCIRDYIHVMDLAAAHVKALEYLQQQNEENHLEIFNVGTGNGNSVLELLTAFEKANNISANYKIAPRRPGDVEKVYADCQKVNQLMGWQAKRDLKEALRDAWKWELYLKEMKQTAGNESKV